MTSTAATSPTTLREPQLPGQTVVVIGGSAGNGLRNGSPCTRVLKAPKASLPAGIRIIS